MNLLKESCCFPDGGWGLNEQGPPGSGGRMVGGGGGWQVAWWRSSGSAMSACVPEQMLKPRSTGWRISLPGTRGHGGLCQLVGQLGL